MEQEKFEEYARECIGWAKTAKTEKERDAFLQMAKTWTEAALVARERNAPLSASSALGQSSPSKDDSAAA